MHWWVGLSHSAHTLHREWGSRARREGVMDGRNVMHSSMREFLAREAFCSHWRV
jgi:hypothetical protein